MLLQALEERMKRGNFTIIYTTHLTQKMVKNYKALAEMYKYTIFVKEKLNTIINGKEWENAITTI